MPRTLALAALALGACLNTVGPPDGAGTSPDSGTAQPGLDPFVVEGTVSLAGGLDPSGVTVTLQNGSNGSPVETAATADGADAGDYLLTGVPAGVFGLAFEKTVRLPAEARFPPAPGGGPATLYFTARIPELVVGADGGAAILDADASYPLAPIELPAGRQLAAGTPMKDVAVSRDGFTVLFNIVDTHTGSGTLWSYVASAGAPVQVATDVGWADLSPDGSRIAYFTQANNGTLFLAPVSGGAPVQVATDASTSFKFSPDGRTLGFWGQANGGTLFLARISGGAPVPVARGVSNFEFSPDGEVVFLTADPNGGTLWRVAATGGTPISIATGVWSGAGSFQFLFSPDGMNLAVLAGDSNGSPTGTLSLLPVSGGPEVTVAKKVLPGGFEFSPDGRLAFVADTAADGTGALALLPLPDTHRVQIATGVYWGMGRHFSPDGMALAYLAGLGPNGGTLYVSPTPWAPPVEFASGVSLSIMEPSFVFSSNGMLAFIEGDPGTLFVTPVGAPSLTQVAAGLSFSQYDDFEFSPDGLSIAFTSGGAVGGTGTLRLAALPGGVPVTLNDHVEAFVTGGRSLVALRGGTPAPFTFMDGVWLTPMP